MDILMLIILASWVVWGNVCAYYCFKTIDDDLGFILFIGSMPFPLVYLFCQYLKHRIFIWSEELNKND